MNAWTGSDFTMYPFSTTNPQDYRNLLSVYSDMAFKANLNYYDFRQEGHRFEFKDAKSTDSDLEIKGVVYNEMKGAMSDPENKFVKSISENLYEKSQYKFNSGGDPEAIPDLTYDQLIEFHSKYYHPTNSTFMTYGDLDFTSHLEFIEKQVLNKFERRDGIQSEVLTEPIGTEMKRADVKFQPDQMSPAEDQCKMSITYVCDTFQTDSYENFKLAILSAMLHQGPNSILYKDIIESGIAPNFCPGVGYDSHGKQGTFTVGVQGIKAEEFEKAENQINQSLLRASKEGVDGKLFNSVLHQLEL